MKIVSNGKCILWAKYSQSIWSVWFFRAPINTFAKKTEIFNVTINAIGDFGSTSWMAFGFYMFMKFWEFKLCVDFKDSWSKVSIVRIIYKNNNRVTKSLLSYCLIDILIVEEREKFKWNESIRIESNIQLQA